MATLSPDLLGVRDTLTQKYGIDNSRIGWDGQFVTIDGKQAIKPTQIGQGRTFADPNTIASGVQPFIQAQTAQTTQAPAAAPNLGQQLGDMRTQLQELFPQQQNPIDQQFSDLLAQLSGRITNQQPVSMQDVLTSPLYAAQQAQIQRQSEQATRAAQEALGSAGLGRSTRLADRAQSIQNDAADYLNTQVLPAIMQGLQSQRDRETAALMDLIGVLGQERQYQQQMRQSELDNLLNLLGFQTGREDVQWERDYRTGRDAVSDARYLDETAYNRMRDTVGDQQYADERAYQMARDAIADEQWKMRFDEDVRRWGLDYALDQARLRNQISDAAADRALRERSLALEERSLNLREQEAARANQLNLDAERRGMVEAIRSGQITPGQALQQIEEDLALGFYSPEEAAILRRDLQTMAANQPVVTPETAPPQQAATIESYRQTIPSDKEIEAEARRLGYPVFDYRAYYKDPDGRMAGLTFEQWKALYGPKLSAR